jgi:hypothetical protein
MNILNSDKRVDAIPVATSTAVVGISVCTLDSLVSDKHISARRISRHSVIVQEALSQYTMRDRQTEVTS